jgi:hypothetical protein
MGPERHALVAAVLGLFATSIIALPVAAQSCGSCAAGGYASCAELCGINPAYRGYQNNTRLDRYGNAAFRPQWYFGGPRYHFVVDDWRCYQNHRAWYSYPYGYGVPFPDGGCGSSCLPRATYVPWGSNRGYTFHTLDRFITGPSFFDIWDEAQKEAARFELYKEAFPPDFVHQREQERKHLEFTKELLNDAGWTLLAEGKSAEALTRFARLATRHRGNGMPKLGFALAAAMQGDDNVAAASVRHALQTDPQSLNQFSVSQALRTRMTSLIARYQKQEELSYRRGDALIMTASLHYLLGEFTDSQAAIARALENGDKFQTTLGLQQLAARAVEHQNMLAMNTEPAGDPAVQAPARSRPAVTAAAFAWFEAD